MVLFCNLGKKINQPLSYPVKKASDGCSLDADSFVELVPRYLYKVPLLFCIQSIKIIYRHYREEYAQRFLIRESYRAINGKGPQKCQHGPCRPDRIKPLPDCVRGDC